MPIGNVDYHLKNFQLLQALGSKRNAGDAVLVPEGYDSVHLLTKSFTNPVIAGGGEIDTAMPGGGATWDQSPIETRFQGGFSMYETESGAAEKWMADVRAAGGYFDAALYFGTPDRHAGGKKLRRCFVKMDPNEIDWENRQQNMMLTGTIFGNFFGETIPPNAA